MSKMTTAFKPGDVVRYDVAGSTHCREGMAIAKERDDGFVYLADTYWTSENHVLTEEEVASAVLLFNLADYDEIDRYRNESRRWQTYAPADREIITAQHRLQTRWFVRKGAEPDLQTQIENACEAFLDEQSKLRSAENRVAVAWRDLAELEAKR